MTATYFQCPACGRSFEVASDRSERIFCGSKCASLGRAAEGRSPNPAENLPAGVGEARPAEPPLNERVAEAREALEGGRESTVDYLVGAPAEEQPDAREPIHEGDFPVMRDVAEQTLDGTLPYEESWHSNAQAVVELVAECSRLREQRDDALSRVKSMHESVKRACERAEAAFQERDGLREQLDAARQALDEIANAKAGGRGGQFAFGLQRVARAALGVVAAGAETSSGSAPRKEREDAR